MFPNFTIPTSLLHYYLLFQMFEDWFSGSGPDGSGSGSELSSVLSSDLSSAFSSEASFGSGSGLDFSSAWGSGEVYTGLVSMEKQANSKRQNDS